jgi:hypothetical protein
MKLILDFGYFYKLLPKDTFIFAITFCGKKTDQETK